MSKKALFLLLIITTAYICPQEWNRARLDSLFNHYISTHNVSNTAIPQNQQMDTLHTKCGFGTAAEVFIHFNEFTESQQKILKTLVSRPVTDTSIVSPSGFFRIHYNTRGSYAPQYDVHEFAKALDSSYNFEVNHLGYPPPPPDTLGGVPPSEAGGDSRYDVYIVNMTDYGETDFETLISQDPNVPRFTSFMQVHYSFGSGFYTHGINAARVTAAHEFHHSIQVGNYIFRDSDLFFYELTSTSMEEFVFDSINDYYGYMSDYFNNTGRAFASNNGYNLAIWNIYLRDNFGIDIIKAQWEMMPGSRAISAINNSLWSEDTNFGNELNKFGIWTFYTNYRAVPGEYFKEASDYPVIRPSINKLFVSPSASINMDAHPTSNNFLNVVDQLNDTITVIVTNSEYQKGIDNPESFSSFQYYVYNYNEKGSQQLTDVYYTKLEPTDPSIWTSSEFYNGLLINEGQIVTTTVDYAFPNPFIFNKSTTGYIYFPVKGGGGSEADLNVYTSAMELVYSVTESYSYRAGQKVLRWNGHDNKNQKVPSGVYIFITNSGSGKIVGKLVIFND